MEVVDAVRLARAAEFYPRRRRFHERMKEQGLRALLPELQPSPSPSFGLPVRAVGWHEREYPEGLRRLRLPPPVLFLRGEAELAGAPGCVAIIGARRSSEEGRAIAYDLARGLVRAGVVVVSGLALGIDAAAHQGALSGGGRTIAVLASPVDEPTPLRTYRPDIVPELVAIIAKAYAREVDDRYQTMAEFVAALAPYASMGSVPVINNIQGLTQAGVRAQLASLPPVQALNIPGTGAVTAVTADAAKPRQSPLTVVFGIATVALLVVGGAGFFYMQQNKSTPTAASSDAPVTTVTVTVTTTATVSAPPIETAGRDAGAASGAGGAGGAAPAVSTTPTATTTRTYRPPHPPVTATATSTSDKPCFKTDPNTGLKVQCHLLDG